jgi:chromosome segregation ATPase
MRKLKEKLDEVSESLEVENEKREIVKTEKNRVQKIVEELRESKEESFSTTFKSVRN